VCFQALILSYRFRCELWCSRTDKNWSRGSVRIVQKITQCKVDEFRAASLKLLIGGPMQASGPINNFALNSSRVGLELKGACHMTKALAKVI
jgi:hypothetical protein